MTEPTPKKLTRRDAIKILGAAAGAAALANLPSKWSAPELTQGILPAHAQTSGPVAPLYSFANCTASITTTVGSILGGILPAIITPATSGISLNLAILSNTGVTVNTDPSGNYNTNGSGQAFSGPMNLFSNTAGAQIVFRWTFNNPAEGTDHCDTTLTWISSP